MFVNPHYNILAETIRYIGETKRTLKNRIGEHLSNPTIATKKATRFVKGEIRNRQQILQIAQEYAFYKNQHIYTQFNFDLAIKLAKDNKLQTLLKLPERVPVKKQEAFVNAYYDALKYAKIGSPLLLYVSLDEYPRLENGNIDHTKRSNLLLGVENYLIEAFHPVANTKRSRRHMLTYAHMGNIVAQKFIQYYK